jgi:hypothetical protein
VPFGTSSSAWEPEIQQLRVVALLRILVEAVVSQFEFGDLEQPVAPSRERHERQAISFFA